MCKQVGALGWVIRERELTAPSVFADGCGLHKEGHSDWPVGSTCHPGGTGEVLVRDALRELLVNAGTNMVDLGG
jgi:hypothetical protein